MVATLPTKLASVKATSRLVGSPVVITDHESGALRRMMKMVEQQNTGVSLMRVFYSCCYLCAHALCVFFKHHEVVVVQRMRTACTWMCP